MENQIAKILDDLSSLKAEVNDILKRLKDIEDEEQNTGVFLDGCPDYAKDYIINNTKDKKDGE